VEAERPRPYERFDADHLVSAALVTGLVGLGLVWVPTPIAVPVLVVVAFLSGRMAGRDAGLGSVAVGCLMYGYAITEPHFVWEIESGRDEALLVVLFVTSLLAAEVGTRVRRRHAIGRWRR
jgi:K+-sensing histidine kinase KdpD